MARPKILEQLQAIAPGITFEQGNTFCWSPQNVAVAYPKRELNETTDVWALLHEVSHGLLGHKRYESDLELLIMESEAWEHALTIGKSLDIVIANDHIQDCLDTYRDWLHKRSTCPTCGVVGLGVINIYTCHNCHTSWSVSNARFCRPYRLKK